MPWGTRDGGGLVLLMQAQQGALSEQQPVRLPPETAGLPCPPGLGVPHRRDRYPEQLGELRLCQPGRAPARRQLP